MWLSTEFTSEQLWWWYNKHIYLLLIEIFLLCDMFGSHLICHSFQSHFSSFCEFHHIFNVFSQNKKKHLKNAWKWVSTARILFDIKLIKLIYKIMSRNRSFGHNNNLSHLYTSFHFQMNTHIEKVFLQELEPNSRFWDIHNCLESIKGK